MEMSESTVWLTGLFPKRAEAAMAQEMDFTGRGITAYWLRGLRSWNVGRAVYVGMELISMVTAPEGDRKTQLGGKGLSAWRGKGVTQWNGSEKWQQGRGAARQPYPES